MKLDLDVTQVEALAKRVSSFDAAGLARASLRAVNDVAKSTHDETTKHIVSGVNLSDQYVRQYLTLTPATSAVKPTAVITGRFRPSNLISYDPAQVTTVVNWQNAVIRGNWARNPRAPNKWLPWKLRKGHAQRGIPVDYKAAGVRVEVARGAPKLMEHSFVIVPKSGKPIVASRKPGEKKKVYAKTGLSVYQLFNAALKRPGYLDGVADRLSDSIVTVLDEEIKKVFG